MPPCSADCLPEVRFHRHGIGKYALLNRHYLRRAPLCTRMGAYGSSSFFFFAHFHFPVSGQAVITGVAPSSPPTLMLSIFIAHRVQQSNCSSIFHRRELLTHALALSASQFVHKKKSQRFYTSMHSAGLELTKLTHTRLEDNPIRHQR